MEDRYAFACMMPDRMEKEPYFYTGNDGHGYPPAHSWRQELALTVVREEVAAAFLPVVNKLTGIEHTIVKQGTR